jgi:hypothetical protein
MRGVDVKVVKADADSREDVDQWLVPRRIRCGCFHLAMVIDDAPLAALTERMRVIEPLPAPGSSMATRDLSSVLRHVLVSSVFEIRPRKLFRGENTFLDSLAHHRRALGLPALTINWGVLGGEGYVAQ